MSSERPDHIYRSARLAGRGNELYPAVDRLDLLRRPDLSISSAREILETATSIDIDSVTLHHPLNRMDNIPLPQLHDAAVTLTIAIAEQEGNPAVKVNDKDHWLRLGLLGHPDDPSIVGRIELVNEWEADAFPMISGVITTATIDVTQEEKDNLGHHFFQDRHSPERPNNFVGPIQDTDLTSVQYKTLLVGKQWVFNAILNWGDVTMEEFPKPIYPPELSRFFRSFLR